MPYLTDDRKKFLADPRNKITTAGDLTYCLTTETLRFIDTAENHTDPDIVGEYSDELMRELQRYLPKVPRYADYAMVLGCLDSTRRELLRRRHETTRRDHEVLIAAGLLEKFARGYYNHVVAPYEDTKIEQNGDVYL